MTEDRDTRIVDFLFEIGTMRKLLRMHRQTLLTDDMSDNIASHSYRVALIGWMLAKEENVDPYKVVMMCMVHDLEEIRSGDHNWVHKKYVKIFEEEIAEDQLGSLPHDELKNIWKEYHERKTKESIVVKDADHLDQLLLLREYEWQGNREAMRWLHRDEEKGEEPNHIKMLKTDSARKFARIIYDRGPSSWWDNSWTSQNR